MKQILEDDRFGAMFKNEDFKIDKDSEAYKLAKPTAANLEGFQSDQEEQEKEVE